VLGLSSIEQVLALAHKELFLGFPISIAVHLSPPGSNSVVSKRSLDETMAFDDPGYQCVPGGTHPT
jgi:hypothetical protein